MFVHRISSRVLCVVLCCSPLSTAVAQQGQARLPTAAESSDRGRKVADASKSLRPATISWDELLPKDWDPMKGLESTDLSQLSDGDPRAAALLRQMRQRWDQAPVNAAMQGRAVRLPGYVVPLEQTAAGMTEILVVPYFGACIHTPPPPANQIIHVVLRAPIKALRAMDAIWLSGVLDTGRADTAMGTSGYRMTAATVEPYTDRTR